MFVVCDRNSARSKPIFSTLLADVTREWQSAGVEVKLSFGEPALSLTEEAALDPSSRANARGASPAPGAKAGKDAKNAVRRVA